jgi:two-component sensor histidine kinase
MEPAKFVKMIRSEKGTISCNIRASNSVSKNFLLTVWNDGFKLTKNVNSK